MKRYFYLTPLLLTLIASCKKDHNNPFIRSSVTSLIFEDGYRLKDSIIIQSNIEWSVTVQPSYPDWLGVSSNGASGNQTIYVYTLEHNISDTDRKGTVVVSPVNNSSVQPITINITQSKADKSRWNTFGGSGSEEFRYTMPMPDGGYIAVGQTTSSDGDLSGLNLNGGHVNLWIVRMDANNKMLWQKLWDGGDHRLDGPIAKTPDGNYIIFSHTFSSQGIWVIKIDENGNILQSKLFTGSSIAHVSSIIPANGGGYILGGSNACTVTKIDENANVIWERSKSATLASGVIWSIVPGADGGYIVTGSAQSKDSPSGSLIVSKLDESGNEVWFKHYGSSQDNGRDIIRSTNGGYIIVGNAGADNGGVINRGFDDIWLLKVDEDGNKVWERSYGGSYSDYAVEITTASDGGYIVAASTTSDDGDIVDARTDDLHSDAWILKIDETGAIVWQKLLGGSGIDAICSVLETSPGHYVGIGYAQSRDIDVRGLKGGQDGWIIPFTK